MATAALELNDEQKIGVLLASLDERLAASVLQQLDPDVMTRVVGVIRSLGVIPGPTREKAIAECLRGIYEMGNAVQGDDKIVNSLLTRAIGEKRASALLQEKAPLEHHAMACLSGVHADQIAGVLAREQPAVIAIVLRYLSADKAGEVIGLLPSEVRKKVVVFLCTAATPSPEVVGRIEAYLSTRLGQGKRSHKVDENNKLEVVTNILQSVDRSVEEELLTAIDDSSETLGNTIRDKLFTFEDIVKLNDVAMRRILQEVDTAGLAIALRSASIDLREKFFRNMSKRSAEALKEEMQFSQKVKLSDVEAKQKEVVNIIRGLDAQGQISIGEEKADEYV